MKGEEKQRKFHEALLDMLYPPPPSPPPQDDKEDAVDRKSTDHLPEELDDEEGDRYRSGSENDEDDSGGCGKLTRAQRKRLRKKKLKEAAASRRRKIIGPMLPGSGDDGNIEVVCERNPAVERNLEENVSGETSSCSKKNKLKQRRQSKKLGGEKLNSSSVENSASHQIQSPRTWGGN